MLSCVTVWISETAFNEHRKPMTQLKVADGKVHTLGLSADLHKNTFP